MKKIFKLKILSLVAMIFVLFGVANIAQATSTISVANNSAVAPYHNAIVKAADRLIQIQNSNGSWDWIVTNFTEPSTTTYLNIAGVTAEGLLDAYNLTGAQKYLDAAKKAGDYIVAGIDAQTVKSINGYNLVFLKKLSNISGVTTYAEKAGGYFSIIYSSAPTTVCPSGCVDTNGLVNGYKNVRGANTIPDGIVAWDLASFVEYAKLAGEGTHASEIESAIVTYLLQESYISTVSSYDLGISAGLKAAALVGDNTNISTFLSKLTYVSGTDIQTTAYSAISLKMANNSRYDTSASYLLGKFIYDTSYNGWLESDSNEYAEVNSEVIQALTMGLSQEQKYYSIQNAINNATSDDIINVSSGTYNESLLIEKPLTIIGIGEIKPVVSGVSSENYIIKINGANNVTINNLEINGGGTAVGENTFNYGVLINNSGTSDNPIKINNSVIKNIWVNGGNGIGMESSSYGLIYNNLISSFHKRGIRFINSGGKFYNNEVIGDNVDGISRVQNLVNLWGGSNVEIYNNKLHNALTTGMTPTWSSPGIFVSSFGGSGDSIANIHDNEIYACDTGIIIGSVYADIDNSTATIENNIFHDLNWGINFEKNTASANINYNKFTNFTKAVNTEGDEPITMNSIINAENNYWGSGVETDFSGKIASNIDYNPWFVDSNMTIPSNIDNIFDGVSTTLTGLGIVNNLNGIDSSNVTDFSGLYFEKVGYGKIIFNSSLNLLNQNTQTFLQNIGNKMDMNKGAIGLDFRGSTDDVSLKGTSATIKFYNLDLLGFGDSTTSEDVSSRLIAKDDSGNIIDKSTLVPSGGTYVGACGVGGECHTFSIGVNHFTKYEIDNTAPSVTKLGDNSTDLVLPIGTTSLVFSETLNNTSKLSVQNALTSGANKTLNYSWSGRILNITATEVTTFANDVIVNVSDLVNNKANLLIVDSKLEDTQIAPEVVGTTATKDVSGSNQEVVIPSVATEVNLTFDSGTTNNTVNMEQFVTENLTNKTGTLPEMTLTTPTIVVEIPNGTEITAPTGWNEIIKAPEIKDNTTVTTSTVPTFAESGYDRRATAVIDIGSTGFDLIFSKGIRVFIPGQANKNVGFIKADNTFYEITSTCSADSQAVGDALLAGEDCKINVGSDLVVWTKHFTQFVAFTRASIPPTYYNGTAYCSNFVYGDWGKCVNGIQTRNILSWNGGNSCSKDLAVTRQTCIVTETKEENNIIVDNAKPFAEEKSVQPVKVIVPTKQVLGAKVYSVGTLLRAPDKKIYVVTKDGRLYHIKTVNELKKYYSKKEILEASSDTIDSYSKKVLGAKVYANGSLLRGADLKIYVIINGKKQHIKTIEELKSKYPNKPVFNVSDEVLSQYGNI